VDEEEYLLLGDERCCAACQVGAVGSRLARDALGHRLFDEVEVGCETMLAVIILRISLSTSRVKK